MNKIEDKRELDVLLRENKRVLALFCASWCPFCESFFPLFDEEVSSYSGVDLIVRVYLDDYDNLLWDEYGVEAVPTLILFQGGQVASRLDAGLGIGLDGSAFQKWLQKV